MEHIGPAKPSTLRRIGPRCRTVTAAGPSPPLPRRMADSKVHRSVQYNPGKTKASSEEDACISWPAFDWPGTSRPPLFHDTEAMLLGSWRSSHGGNQVAALWQGLQRGRLLGIYWSPTPCLPFLSSAPFLTAIRRKRHRPDNDRAKCALHEAPVAQGRRGG